MANTAELLELDNAPPLIAGSEILQAGGLLVGKGRPGGWYQDTTRGIQLKSSGAHIVIPCQAEELGEMY